MALNLYYIVPEDLDDASHPNLTVLPAHSAARPPSLAEVRAAFALPGQYHFRFKRAFKSGFVWVDGVDESAAVPLFDGYVFAKVSRIAVSSQASSGAPVPIAAQQPVAAKQATRPAPAAAPEPEVWGEEDVWKQPAAPPMWDEPKAATAAAASTNSDDLFGLLSGSSAPAASATAAAPALATADLFSSSAAGDFWGDSGFATATPPQQPSPPPRPASGNGQSSIAANASKPGAPKPKVPTELGSQAAMQFTL